jgi:hypothetical protein
VNPQVKHIYLDDSKGGGLPSSRASRNMCTSWLLGGDKKRLQEIVTLISRLNSTYFSQYGEINKICQGGKEKKEI